MGRAYMNGTRDIVRLIILILAFVIVPSIASGDIRRFVPRIFGYEGDLEIEMRHESNENRSQDRGLKVSDTALTERIRLSTSGFVYHPRFILFLAKVSGGLKHEKFKSSTVDYSWSTSTADEYEFKTLILPEHHYTLELFTSRKTYFAMGRLSKEIKPVSYTKGATFHYKKRPILLDATYILNTVTTKLYTTDSKTYGVSSTYFRHPLHNVAGHSHSDSTSSNNTKNKRNYYFLENEIEFNKIRLNSGVNFNSSKQESSATYSMRDDTLSWTEQLNIELPWNFSSSLYYNRYDDTLKTITASTSSESKAFSKIDNTTLTISHRLYRSLATNYSQSYVRAKTSGGDIKAKGHALSSIYAKTITGGTLRLGINLNKLFTDRGGAPATINEVYNAKIFDEFTLKEQNIDETTIIVRVKSPDTGALIDLQTNTHYIVFRIGNTFNIRILSVPAEVLSSDPNFIYEFRVTYSAIKGDFELKTTEFGYLIELSLLDKLINPYYRYQNSKQNLISGTIPGGIDNVTRQTIGILLVKAPYSLLGEYQDVSSRIKPSKAYRTELAYSKDIDTTTNLYAKIHYSKISYSQISLGTESKSYSDTLSGIGVSLQKTFPRRRLYLALGGSYAQRQGVATTRIYALNSVLSWKFRELDIAMNANINFTESKFATEKTKNTSETFYLNVKKKLF